MDRFQDRATKYFRSAAVKWWWNSPPPAPAPPRPSSQTQSTDISLQYDSALVNTSEGTTTTTGSHASEIASDYSDLIPLGHHHRHHQVRHHHGRYSGSYLPEYDAQQSEPTVLSLHRQQPKSDSRQTLEPSRKRSKRRFRRRSIKEDDWSRHMEATRLQDGPTGEDSDDIDDQLIDDEDGEETTLYHRRINDEPDSGVHIEVEPVLMDSVNRILPDRFDELDDGEDRTDRDDDFDDELQGDDDTDGPGGGHVAVGTEDLSEEDHQKRIALRRKLYSKQIFGTVQLDGFASRFGQYRPYLHNYGRHRYQQRPPNIERSNTEPSSQTVQSFIPLSPSSISPSSTPYSGELATSGIGCTGDGNHLGPGGHRPFGHQYGTSSSASSLLLMMNNSQHQLAASPSNMDGGNGSTGSSYGGGGGGHIKVEPRRNDSTSSVSSGGSPYLHLVPSGPMSTSPQQQPRFLPQPKLSQVTNRQIFSSHSVDECSTGLCEPDLVSMLNRTSLENMSSEQPQMKTSYISGYEPRATLYQGPKRRQYKRHPLVQSSLSVDTDRMLLVPTTRTSGSPSPSLSPFAMGERRSPIYSEARRLLSSKPQTLNCYGGAGGATYQPSSLSSSPVDKDDEHAIYYSAYQQQQQPYFPSTRHLQPGRRRQLPTIKSLPLITGNAQLSMSTVTSPSLTATSTTSSYYQMNGSTSRPYQSYQPPPPPPPPPPLPPVYPQRTNLSIPSLRLTHSFDDSSMDLYDEDGVPLSPHAPSHQPEQPSGRRRQQQHFRHRHHHQHRNRNQPNRLHQYKQYSFDCGDLYRGTQSFQPEATPSADQWHHRKVSPNNYWPSNKSPVNNRKYSPVGATPSPSPSPHVGGNSPSPKPPPPQPSTVRSHPHQRIGQSTSMHRKLPNIIQSAYLQRYEGVIFFSFFLFSVFLLPVQVAYFWCCFRSGLNLTLFAVVLENHLVWRMRHLIGLIWIMAPCIPPLRMERCVLLCSRSSKPNRSSSSRLLRQTHFRPHHHHHRNYRLLR